METHFDRLRRQKPCKGIVFQAAKLGLTQRRRPPGSVFPMAFYVSKTDPLIMFQILPGIQNAFLPYPMTHAVVYGMNVIVEQCIVQKGDSKIPPGGIASIPGNVGIMIKSSDPGRIDIRYSMAARIFRGLWELTARYGSYTVAVDVYVGPVGRASYGGRATIFIRLGDSNKTFGLASPGLLDEAVLTL